MHLKSLTLRGFKSFASATTLNFEPGITCVVGPNGSGKSNVVDALSWVMGEQGAKSLRGGKMEDVIFAGTSGRAPLGRAEVVLTIDNTDGALPIEYAEVTIARTMFRNGGSEYAINGHAARLLDVQELLSDSGIGREMHVIVGQGQLDSILQATPEGRRGFIEEAAGVLKHRKRKEKALRKLESTEGNLNRLADLISEIRRQLKPLGRQAEVARKAAVIQLEARDARARLLADDLTRATLSLQSELADEARLKSRRVEVEAALLAARHSEAEAEATLARSQPQLAAAQEAWYGLAGLKERIASTASIAAERVRYAEQQPNDTRQGRDPAAIDLEAQQVRAQEDALSAEATERSENLKQASDARAELEAEHRAAEQRHAAQIRAVADRREGLARLRGQVNTLRSRTEAAGEEIGRLEQTRDHTRARHEKSKLAFTSLESKIAGLDDGELGLDSDHEHAAKALDEVSERLAELRSQEQAAGQSQAAAAARLDALRLGLERRDGSAALLAATDRLDGLLGSVAGLVHVEADYEAAVAAAFGAAADAVAVRGGDAAVDAIELLKSEDLGRAALVLAGDRAASEDAWPALPPGVRYAADVVTCSPELRPSVVRILRKVAIVDDIAAARELVEQFGDLMAVTLGGDVLSAWFAAGGSPSGQSLLEIQAAVAEAEKSSAEAEHAVQRLRFNAAELADSQLAAQSAVDDSMAKLNESDAALAALAEELAQHTSVIRSADGEARRLEAAIAKAEEARSVNAAGLVELEERLALAAEDSELPNTLEPDPSERDALAEKARLARGVEMDARLALRTVEERARALAGRADSLRRSAENERRARREAQARRAQAEAEGAVARSVQRATAWLLERVAQASEQAAAERMAAESERHLADQALTQCRTQARELAAELERLVDVVHRDELARAEQRMRVESLAEKALTDLGLEAETLLAEYGPELTIPVLTRPDGSALAEDDEIPDPIPFVRAEQEKRLRGAERNLTVLGRVNPLALEEFDAMSERHAFLAEQLEDLRQTRKDLADIIVEVDNRVEQVFAEAYVDVEAAFERVFARLFPGGEGRLILTEPGQWLTTGVDVEARPPGKKVKRLSLLSGGERSLVAVAFLVALFIARPSPFYILDEVEAALDDTNLGRLLAIYEELRENSQLLVITHQKRTMEIADALYGVTMRGDGVSAVISQRLREEYAV